MRSLKSFALAFINRKKLISLIPLPFLLGGVTALFTYIRHIPESSFLEKWLHFYGLALFIIIPFKIMLENVIDLLINKHLQEKSPLTQGLAFSLAFFGSMSTAMTGLAIYSLNKIDSVQQFSHLWVTELLKNFPVVLGIIIVFGGIIKPALIRKNQRKTQLRFIEDGSLSEM